MPRSVLMSNDWSVKKDVAFFRKPLTSYSLDLFTLRQSVSNHEKKLNINNTCRVTMS